MADEAIKTLAVAVALNDSSFQTGMKSLKSQMAVVDSSFKSSVAGLKNWGTNIDALKNNSQSLGEKMNVQRQIIQAYSQQLDKSSTALEQNSQKMLDLKSKVEAARSAYEQSKAATAANSDETKILKTSLETLEKQYLSSEKLVAKNSTTVNGYTAQLNNAKSKLKEMDAELSENNAKIKVNELTVGRLKSSFSALAAQSQKSASSIGGHLSSLKSTILGFGAAAVAGLSIKSIISATDSAEKTMAQMGAVLKSTGGAAGMTKQQLIDLAASQAEVTTYSKGTTEQAENMLLTFTNIKSNVFPATIKAAEDMATAMGTSATDAAKTLGKAMNDPAAGLSKLTKQGVTFTDAQKKQIKSMQAAGNTAGAQKIILQELNKEFGNSAKAAGSTFTGGIQIMQNNLKGAGVTIASALLPVVTNLMPSVVKAANNLASTVTAHKGEIIGAVSTAAGVVKNIFGFIESHGALVKGVVIGIAAAVGIWKVAMFAANTVSTVSNALQVLGIIKSGAAATAKLGEASATGVATAAQTGLNLAMLPAIGIIAAIVAAVALLAFGAYELVKHWSTVSAFFKGLWKNVSGAFVTAWQGIESFFGGVWKWMTGFFGKWGTVILAVLVPFIGIPLLIYQHFGQITGWLSGIWNAAVKGVSGFVGSVKNAIGGIGNVIVHAFDSGINFIKNLPGEALQWGKDFINGIVKGITAAVGAIKTAVGNVAQSIRSFLHFSVPDEGPLVDYESWMPDMMTGLAKGIEASKYKVSSAIQGLSQNVSVGVKATVGENNTQAAVAASTAGNSQNVIINFNGSYGFSNRKDIDYFMNQAALIVNRRR